MDEVSRARALLYDFLSLFFLPDFDDEKYRTAKEVIENIPSTGIEDFDAAKEALAASLRKKEAAEIREEFETLFITPFEGAQIPLEASYYLEGKIYGPSLSKLRELLLEIGLVKQSDVSEPEDHLGLLLAFMAEAIRKKGLSRQRKLFYNFLRPCALEVAGKIEGERAPFYRLVGGMLKAFLRIEEHFFEEN